MQALTSYVLGVNAVRQTRSYAPGKSFATDGLTGGDLLHCDGSAAPLTNIYPPETAGDDWTDWEPGDSGVANPERMSSLIYETRSSAWVAEVGVLLAQGLESPAWFVGSADVAWPVGAVKTDGTSPAASSRLT